MKLFKLLSALTTLSLPSLTTSSPIDSLARDISNVESIRSIKDTTRQFAHLLQFGQFEAASSLFSPTGVLQWGNTTISTPASILSWLKKDAGDMNGITLGSLNTCILETPLINLSPDGKTAKGRWNGLRFQGDGKGGTRIQGGIYENEYSLSPTKNEGWKISLLKYYPLYEGPYIGGWRNVGGLLKIVPYHFTPENAGVPIPSSEGEEERYEGELEDLEKRVGRLKDEDAVRNLQHAYGYYVDRRMWSDVVDLFVSSSAIKIGGYGTWEGKEGIRKAMERMGPEGLTQGILNDHPIFDTIVEVDDSGEEAIARGIEIGMLGDANTGAASWEFNVFRNTFVKDEGVWKMKEVDITPLMMANYSTGWGNGGFGPVNTFVPDFVDISRGDLRTKRSRTSRRSSSSRFLSGVSNKLANTTDIQRRLSRSAAYDGAESASAAYSYYLDDLQCDSMGTIHASKGHKLSPFNGWFQTPSHIASACHAVYGNASLSTLRSSISFHWRPQPVAIVSDDGRSVTYRARLLQPSTSNKTAGFFNAAMYHDQMVLEDGKWKLWSITIDEFYWQSVDWAGGWAAAKPRNSTAPNPSPSKKLVSDCSLVEVGERERGFEGGVGRFVQWPEIQRMWFQYSNLVSGRTPEFYWPGCVPCQVRKEWRLDESGYQEPPNGPVGNVAGT